jgi:hypothetical protein
MGNTVYHYSRGLEIGSDYGEAKEVRQARAEGGGATASRRDRGGGQDVCTSSCPLLAYLGAREVSYVPYMKVRLFRPTNTKATLLAG